MLMALAGTPTEFAAPESSSTKENHLVSGRYSKTFDI
jgi:hypothetical protein